MAPTSKPTKRKASSTSAPNSKKARKTPTSKAVPTTSAPAKHSAPAKQTSQPRKKAADFYSSGSESEAADEEWVGIQESPAKKSKPANLKPTKAQSSEAKPSVEPVEEVQSHDAFSESDSESDDDDDQTAALLKGFESSDDEEETATDKADGAKLAKAGIPDEKRVKKKLEAASAHEKNSTPGVIYLGRIPHGFFEHEMRSYFSQFGPVSRLRLSRNKKTGKSKHYAFIEFESAAVAQIVQETMNKYLLFGHILRCEIVPRDNLERIEQLFKGANRRFKPRPGAKLQKAAYEKKRTADEWQEVVKRENIKRKRLSTGLKKVGIEYDFEAPLVKAT